MSDHNPPPIITPVDQLVQSAEHIQPSGGGIYEVQPSSVTATNDAVQASGYSIAGQSHNVDSSYTPLNSQDNLQSREEAMAHLNAYQTNASESAPPEFLPMDMLFERDNMSDHNPPPIITPLDQPAQSAEHIQPSGGGISDGQPSSATATTTNDAVQASGYNIAGRSHNVDISRYPSNYSWRNESTSNTHWYFQDNQESKGETSASAMATYANPSESAAPLEYLSMDKLYQRVTSMNKKYLAELERINSTEVDNLQKELDKLDLDPEIIDLRKKNFQFEVQKLREYIYYLGRPREDFVGSVTEDYMEAWEKEICDQIHGFQMVSATDASKRNTQYHQAERSERTELRRMNTPWDLLSNPPQAMQMLALLEQPSLLQADTPLQSAAVEYLGQNLHQQSVDLESGTLHLPIHTDTGDNHQSTVSQAPATPLSLSDYDDDSNYEITTPFFMDANCPGVFDFESALKGIGFGSDWTEPGAPEAGPKSDSEAEA